MVRGLRGPVRGREETSGQPPDDQDSVDSLTLMNRFTGIVDRKGKLQFASESTVKGLGYEQDEILKKPFWEASWFAQSSESQKVIKDSILDALEGESVRCEVEASAKDGTIIPVVFNISQLKGQEGNIVSIVAEGEPTVEARELEEDEEPDRRLGAVFELMGEAYYEVDKRDRIVAISLSGARLLGYESSDQLIGKRMEQFWASSEERDAFLMELSRKGKVEGYESSLLRKDGTEAVVRLDVRHLYDEKGNVRGSEGVFRDVTQTNELERLLEEARSDLDRARTGIERYEEQYAKLIEHPSDGIAIVQDGVLRIANAHVTSMTGYTSEELEGIPIEQILTPDSMKLLLKNRKKKAAEDGVSQIHEIKALTKHGETLPLEISIGSMEYQGGLANVVFMHDMRKQQGENEAARERDLRYEAIFNNPLEMVYITDLEGRFLEVNEYGLERLGYTLGEIRELTFMELVHPHDLTIATEGWAAASWEDEIASPIEIRVVSKSGETIWIHSIAIPLERDGSAYVIVSSARDITERKQAEEKLRESEWNLKSALNNMRDIYFRTDVDGNVILLNSAALELFRYDSADEIVGTNIFESSLHPEELTEIFVGLVDQARTSGRGLESAKCHTLTTKSGDVITIEAFIDDVLNERGEVIAVEGFARDLSDRQQSEAKWKESEERYSELVERSNDCIFVVQDEVFKFVNAKMTELTGCSKDELIGSGFMHLLAPESLELIKKRNKKRTSGKEVPNFYEVDIIDRNGNKVPVEVNAGQIEYDGRPANLVFLRDVRERKRVEVDLLNEKAFNEAIIDSLPDIFYALDDDLQFVRVNANFERVTGYSWEEISELHPLDLFAGDDKETIADVIQQSLVKGDYGARANIVSKNGNLTPYRFSATRMVRDSKNYVVGTGMDISERMQAEETLRKSEMNMRSVLDNMRDIYFRTDTVGNITLMSPPTLQFFRYDSVDEVVGKNIMDSLLHPEELMGPFMRLMGQASESGESIDELEAITLTTKSGGLISVESYVNSVFDENGQVVGIEGIARDVTERKQTEERLKESEEKFRSIFENMRDIYFKIDAQGQIIMINPAGVRMLGYETAEDIIGMSAFEILEHPQEAMNLFSELLGGGGTSSPVGIQEFALKVIDREPVIIEYAPWIVMDEVGDVVAIEGLGRDITGRKEMQANLKESEEKYRSLFENMHDAYFRFDVNSMAIANINPAGKRMLGYDSESHLIGKSIQEVFSNTEDIIPMISHAMTDPGMLSDIQRLEIPLALQDEQTMEVEVYPSFNYDDQGRLVTVDGIMRDITERKRYEERLKNSEERLLDLVDRLRLSQELLSTPVVQVWDRILVLPLIGILDSTRAQRVMEVLLNRIIETQTEMVIMDVTGVATMDTEVTNHLIRTIQSTALLGSKCVITGINPEVAQSMVQLGMDMSKLVTKRDLQDGLKYGLSTMGYKVGIGQVEGTGPDDSESVGW